MSEKAPNNKRGRPKIPLIVEDIGDLEKKIPARTIIFEDVLYWMDLGATAEEIAGSRHVSVDTLDRRLREQTGLSFAELKEKCCGQAKMNLRENQYHLTKTNASMGIWLGKNWLGQKDNDKIEVSQINLVELKKALADGELSQK